MNRKTILVFLSALFRFSLQAKYDDSLYRAAVVEFAPSNVLEDNLKEYEWFIKQAKQTDVDIIIFPERTLHELGGDTILEDNYSEIPDPESRIIPCNSNDYEKWRVLERLSCAALDNAIYVVANILELAPSNESESIFNRGERVVYNTNVVFDRSGTIISRYRKYNLHNDPFINATDEPELQMFDTDFGVRFGVFTSFDILFKTPAVDLVEMYNITSFVYPSYWYGELPFSTAIQIQSGWSYTMNVVLLAAGANRPSTGTGGSGIYAGRLGPLIFSMHGWEISTALISSVPKNVRSSHGLQPSILTTSTVTSQNKKKHSTTKSVMHLQKDETVKDSRTVLLRDDGTEFDEEICTGRSLCCRFRVSYKKNREAKQKSYQYRALAYQGDKTLIEGVTGGVEACAIVLCTGPEQSDCGRRPEPSSDYLYIFSRIDIAATFSSNQTIQMPNILMGSELPGKKTEMVLLGPGHYDFQRKEEDTNRSIRMTLKDEARSVITFGIYSRDFVKSGAFIFRHSIFVLIFTLFFVNCFK